MSVVTKLLVRITKVVMQRCNYDGYRSVELVLEDVFPGVSIDFKNIYTVGRNCIQPFDMYPELIIPLPSDVFCWISDLDRCKYYKKKNYPELMFEIELSEDIVDYHGCRLQRLLNNHPFLELFEE